MLAEKSTKTTTVVAGCASAATDTAAGAKKADTISRSSLIIVRRRLELGALLLGPHDDAGHDEADRNDPAGQIELRHRDDEHDEGDDHHDRADSRESHVDASWGTNGAGSAPGRGPRQGPGQIAPRL